MTEARVVHKTMKNGGQVVVGRLPRARVNRHRVCGWCDANRFHLLVSDQGSVVPFKESVQGTCNAIIYQNANRELFRRLSGELFWNKAPGSPAKTSKQEERIELP